MYNLSWKLIEICEFDTCFFMFHFSVFLFSFFFFNATATTEIYTLSLHDALPIFVDPSCLKAGGVERLHRLLVGHANREVKVLGDRKSTRLNSSHGYISYAVFCLKKKTISRQTGVYSSLTMTRCFHRCFRTTTIES